MALVTMPLNVIKENFDVFRTDVPRAVVHAICSALGMSLCDCSLRNAGMYTYVYIFYFICRKLPKDLNFMTVI